MYNELNKDLKEIAALLHHEPPTDILLNWHYDPQNDAERWLLSISWYHRLEFKCFGKTIEDCIHKAKEKANSQKEGAQRLQQILDECVQQIHELKNDHSMNLVHEYRGTANGDTELVIIYGKPLFK